ncbi:MAG: hypothetical protein RBS80_08880 [Thermoguttaceae bacterium]|jgi:hypothetical protein|nr:hypothetical protein [Thermoguttaceae bacterium]
MRKAELEDHHNQYLLKDGRIREMVQQRDFPAVFAVCKDAVVHMVPAMKWRKQAGITPETPEFLCFSVICTYGPPLFEHTALESMYQFVGGTRQLARHENGYLVLSEAALKQEEVARALWNCIERQPGLPQSDLSERCCVPDKTVASIVNVWKQLRIIGCEYRGNEYRLSLCTRLDVEVVGICQHCGAKGNGRKEQFLQPVKCGKCMDVGYCHVRFDEAG